MEGDSQFFAMIGSKLFNASAPGVILSRSV